MGLNSYECRFYSRMGLRNGDWCRFTGSFSFLVMFSWVFSASLKQRLRTEALIKKQKILQQAWEAICNHYQSSSSQLVICRTRKLYLCERIVTGEN